MVEKIYTRIIETSLRKGAEQTLKETQCRFRKGGESRTESSYKSRLQKNSQNWKENSPRYE